MQLMAKDKFYYPVLLGMIFLAYSFYVIFDHFQFNDHGVSQIIETRSDGMQYSPEKIEGIIIGGSNAMWGISAKQLSNQTGIKFYNLSMHSNGVNYQNYFEYLEKSFQTKDANEVKYIFWSTIHAIHEPPWNDFDRDIAGRLRLSKMIPNKSLLGYTYAKLINQEQILFEVTKEFGDFDFKNFKCTLSDPKFLEVSDINRAYAGGYSMVNPLILKPQLEIYRNFLIDFFPNAQIVFIIPATLHEVKYDSGRLKDLDFIMKGLNLKFHFQEPMTDISNFCESDHHPNEIGRQKRTNDLALLFQSLL
jgi:hypothetical protein